METDQVRRWLQRYGQAWSERDPAQAAALFSSDAQYAETPFGPVLRGRDEIAHYWREVPRSQVNVRFDAQVLWAGDGTACATWQAQFTRAATGRVVELDGVFVLTFDEAALCRSLREWWHRRET